MGDYTTGDDYRRSMVVFEQCEMCEIYMYILSILESVCVCVCILIISKRIHIAVCGPIGTKCGTHMLIHLEKAMGEI